jgi:AcrR family transcriptional regulator
MLNPVPPMKESGRREREKQRRRESILRSAEKIFFTQGYEHSSMEDIAKAAELSRALLYVYFRDKSAILAAIALRAGQSLRHRFELALSQTDSGIETIRALGLEYYRFSIEETAYFDLLTQMEATCDGSLADPDGQALDQEEQAIMNLMHDALALGLEDGSIDAKRLPDPAVTAFFLRGALHGVIMQARVLARMTGDPLRAKALVHYGIEMLTCSLRKGGDSS